MLLGAFNEGAVPFWIGGEAAMPLGIGGIALLIACIPSYLIASTLVARIARIPQLGAWQVLVVGFLQGLFFLYVLVAISAMATRLTSRLGVRFPGIWELGYIFTNFATATLIACAVPAVLLAIVLRGRRNVRGNHASERSHE
jgi:hypothetical protein